MSPKRYKPGQTVPESGQYTTLTRMLKGVGRFDHPGEVTCVKGEPFPPHRVPVREVFYELADATKHKKKRKKPKK